MSVINCYYIKDAKSCLSELVIASDIGGLNVKYFQKS